MGALVFIHQQSPAGMISRASVLVAVGLFPFIRHACKSINGRFIRKLPVEPCKSI